MKMSELCIFRNKKKTKFNSMKIKKIDIKLINSMDCGILLNLKNKHCNVLAYF